MGTIQSIMDIGKQALFASQSAINITGNNIANVDTPGYHRRSVVFQENMSLDYYPGQMGTGVIAKEVIRYFDSFVEQQYNEKSSLTNRYLALYENLRGVDNLFNESNTAGLNSALSQFFADWQDLSLRPDDFSTREALVANTLSMLDVVRNMDRDLALFQNQMDEFVGQEVEEVNKLIEEIAELNRQIGIHDIPGQNNANELYDKRDLLVRELAEKIDIDIIDNGSGEYSVLTSAGHTLVHGIETFEIKFEGPKSYMALTGASQFDGDIHFDGSDDYEYLIEVVQGGQVSDAAGAAQFRVSLDGGRTWLQDETGKTKLFSSRTEDQKVGIGDLTIWFDAGSGNNLEVGDKFTVVPKSGLYWYENTSDFMNITPQKYFDGSDNARRLIGGEIAGYLSCRDEHLGKYRTKLDAMAEGLIWEVNRMHSQGAGLTRVGEALGTYGVRDASLALSDDSSGLVWNDRLEAGGVQLFVYDSGTGENVSNASGPVDFDAGTPGIQNFDPDIHSLEDVRDAINNTYSGYLTASIQDNQLLITAEDGYEFAFGSDSAGLWAGLGLNTFFDGYDATTISINAEVRFDLNRLNAGRVNGAAEHNPGDNTTALGIAGLKDKQIGFTTALEGTVTQTISDYYNILVSAVGGDTSAAEFNYMYQNTLAEDLDFRQEEIGGVNLDEEMSNLIKYQHSYTAAAKLITTADQMLQTLLSLKT